MTSGQDRLEGYRLAHESQQIPMHEELVVEGEFTESSGREGARKLLAASPTAIFAASDSMAIGALKTLRKAGLRVPEDVALVGFDDVPIATAAEPALTTIRQPIRDLGSQAASLLLDLLAGQADRQTPSQRIILPAELVVRHSCGATA
jgi:LacI family transcriptional regulator